MQENSGKELMRGRKTHTVANASDALENERSDKKPHRVQLASAIVCLLIFIGCTSNGDGSGGGTSPYRGACDNFIRKCGDRYVKESWYPVLKSDCEEVVTCLHNDYEGDCRSTFNDLVTYSRTVQTEKDCDKWESRVETLVEDCDYSESCFDVSSTDDQKEDQVATGAKPTTRSGEMDVPGLDCPSIEDIDARPDPQAVGKAIQLEPDVDLGDYGSSEVTYSWSSSPSDGYFDDAREAFTDFICVSPGDFSLRLAVSTDDGCSSKETVTVACQMCGDGILDSYEECDDGNTVSNDGCSIDCRVERDSIVNGNLDGGTIDGGGTSTNGQCNVSVSMMGMFTMFTIDGVCQSPADECIGATPDQLDLSAFLPTSLVGPMELSSTSGGCGNDSVCCLNTDQCSALNSEFSSGMFGMLFPDADFACVPPGTCAASGSDDTISELSFGCPNSQNCCVRMPAMVFEGGLPISILDAGVF